MNEEDGAASKRAAESEARHGTEFHAADKEIAVARVAETSGGGVFDDAESIERWRRRADSCFHAGEDLIITLPNDIAFSGEQAERSESAATRG